VLEQDTDCAQRASGNRLGVMAPKFTKTASLSERFSLTAWQYQLRQLAQLGLVDTPNPIYQPCGMIQLAYSSREHDRLREFTCRFPDDVVQNVSGQTIKKLSGITSPCEAHYVRHCGAMSPRLLVSTLLADKGVELHTQNTVTAIAQSGQAWEITTQHPQKGSTTLRAPVLIIANGAQLSEWLPEIPITPAQGQTSLGTLASHQNAPTTVIGHKGYLIPNGNEQIVFGATFKRGVTNTQLSEHDSQLNVAQLQQYLPDIKLEKVENGHTAIRATTTDRWPIVGPIPDYAFYRSHYADLNLGKHYKAYPDAKSKPGLYTLGGLGSRGLSTAGYCAALLSEEITAGLVSSQNTNQTKTLDNDHGDSHQNLSSEKAIREALHPARFLIRELKRSR